MKVVVAPNAFKGCMNGIEAAEAMNRGIQRVSADIKVVRIPVADGGDGLVEILARALDGQMIKSSVAGPLTKKVTASFCYVESTGLAIVEMAKASGLALLTANERNPEKTTTFGTGQLINKCLDLDIKHLVVGLGGSATCDGGVGAAAALGYRFLDYNGVELEPIGGNLVNISTIDTDKVDPRIKSVHIEAVCDVINPFTGKNGASYVYSPQKGADSRQVERLDEGLRNLAAIIRRDLGFDIEKIPGSGAAGGLGGGLHAFLGADLKKGIDLVLDIVGLREKVKGADLVLTGEGQIDYQTEYDKAPAGVAKIARDAGVPCIAVCGSIGDRIDSLYDTGVEAIFSLCKSPVSLAHAIENGPGLLADATEQVMRLFICSKK